MFRPNCRAIFRQVECTINNAVNLRDRLLQELFKIIIIEYNLLKRNIVSLLYILYLPSSEKTVGKHIPSWAP
jgi:hypothetical protein